MSGFIDHAVKKVIREQWCKPLIKHLCENLGYKLTYLGLPGIEAIDILTWIDYLNKVIAFDIGHYSKDYNDLLAKKEIAKLYKKLSILETNGSIETFSLHHGYIEEVVLKGMDRSGIAFNQNNVVTIYNLDFCNTLTVPLKIVDPFTGDVAIYYKSEVFKKLLALQKGISLKSKDAKFIFYLTIHSHFWEDEGKRYFSGEKYRFYKEYSAKLSHLEESDRNVRLLRFYIIELLSTQFCLFNFIPEFLPTLDYIGVGNNRLLCFTVIGTYLHDSNGKTPFYQKIEDLINEKFLRPNEKELNYFIHSSLEENNCIMNSVNAIQSLKSYNKIWMK